MEQLHAIRSRKEALKASVAANETALAELGDGYARPAKFTVDATSTPPPAAGSHVLAVSCERDTLANSTPQIPHPKRGRAHLAPHRLLPFAQRPGRARLCHQGRALSRPGRARLRPPLQEERHSRSHHGHRRAVCPCPPDAPRLDPRPFSKRSAIHPHRDHLP